MKQQMNIDAPPMGDLPKWGKRISFEHFFVELVSAGPRSFNVRLDNSFASISFSGDEGRSSLGGDRLRRYDRRPYEFIVAPPGFPLRGQSTEAPEVLVIVFEFDALRSAIAPALQVPHDQLEPRVIIGSPKPLITSLAERARKHILAHRQPDEYLRSLCTLLLVEMLRPPAGQRNGTRRRVLKKEVVAAILKFIDANLDNDLSLETLARLAGVLPHQFSRAFKRRAGQSPHHYVLERRVAAARHWLTTTQRPIADIAYDTGFSSQSHMTTTFKRELGMTPAQLRQEVGD